MKTVLRQVFLFLYVVALEVYAKKYIYASEHDCDRHSLDAVYNEKFKPITANVFKDTTVFVNRVTELVAESLTSLMTELPDRTESSNQEKRIFHQFKSIRSAFSSKMKKVQKNITAMWDSLSPTHLDLLLDNGKSNLQQYLNKTRALAEAFQAARKSIDDNMSQFMSFIKGTVRDGIEGINIAANNAIQKEDREKNETKVDPDQPTKVEEIIAEESEIEEEEIKEESTEEINKQSSQEETKQEMNEESSKEETKQESLEDRMLKKKTEIAEMILQGFLKRVTVQVLERKIDLFRKVDTKPENRDTVMDDLLFDILMIRNRILAIIQPDLPQDKGSVDLARRSVYSYWASLATEMYKEKLKSKQAGGVEYYNKLWSNEDQIVDTLLNLMEVY